MKYDPRIKNELLISDPFNADTAKKYIGKKGYFTDGIASFSNLDKCFTGMLVSVEVDNEHPYYCGISDEGIIIQDNFSFFLSAEFVEEKPKEKPKEKKYRPYTIEEFCNEGFEIVVFRERNNPLMEYHVRYNGYTKGDIFYTVILGNIRYTFKELFENFEYLDSDGEWKPFGVEEE